MPENCKKNGWAFQNVNIEPLEVFAITNVVALNLFALIFVSVLYLCSWLLFYNAFHIVTALPTIATAIVGSLSCS